MCKKLIYLIPFVFVLGSVSNAEDIQWTDLGADHLWSTPENWDLGRVPTLADDVRIDVPAAGAPNGPIIQDGIDAKANGIFTEAPGEPTLTMTGGTLEVANWIWWGDGENSFGIWEMSGGTVSVVNEFELGWGGGAGTLTMTGGTIDAGEAVIPTGSGAFGELYLNGGTYNVTKADGLSVKENGLIDITEGTLVLEGDDTAKVNDLIAAGLITAYGGDGQLELDFDGRNPGKTTLTATIEKTVLFAEDFEGLALGPNVDEALAGDAVWTDTPPEGWSIDESGIPGINLDATDGVTEWAGWAFADKEWWIAAAEDQDRSTFELGSGTVAVADPDEWDDDERLPIPIFADPYDTWLTTPEIKIASAEAGTLELKFDSSWRPEFDDNYHQTANITASFDGGDPVEVMLWESDEASANFHPYATNETVIVKLDNPEGAKKLVLTFGLFDAGNDWWWAIDNLEVRGVVPYLGPVDPGTEGLAAYYPLDNDVLDASGNGNDGTITGDPTFVEGVAGMAMEFDGDDYVNCGNGPSLQIQDAITMAFWFQVESFQNTWEGFMAKGDDSYRVSRGGGTGDATHMGISGTSVGGGSGWFNGTVIVTGGQWHHMAAVYDGAEGRIYIDGVLDTTSPGTGQINISNFDFWIGNNSQQTGRFFHGLLDEVMIYSRVLSEAEIRYLAGERATPVDPGTYGLVAYYALENNTDDSSGNELHGTIVGEPTYVEGPAGYGTAMAFDGVDDYVDFGNDPIFDITEQVTLAVWVNANDMLNSEHNPWLGKGDNCYAIKHQSGNYLEFFIFDGGWNSTVFTDYDESMNGEWHHTAGTYDGSELKFYLDGEVAATLVHEGSIETRDHPVTMGTNSEAGGRFYDGALDEAVIYNRALSAGEVRYLAGFRAMVDPGTEGLAAAYEFETDATDSSGNGNDGTFLGDAHVQGGLLVLDGDDDAVAIPGIGDGLTEFTFSMMVYPTVDVVPLQFSGGINTDSWGGGVHLKLNYGNVNVGVNGLGGGDVVGTTIAQPNTWTHLALTVSPDEVAVYFNGEKEGSRTGETVPAVNVGAATIGAWNNGGTDVQREMTGMMDNVLIYNRALSEAEVRYLAGLRTDAVNLLQNPSFEEDEPILDDPDWVSWCTWNPAEGAGSNTTIVDTESIDGTRSLLVEPKGAENWHFILVNISFAAQLDKNYTAGFWAKAEAPRPLTVQMKASDNSVDAWGATDFELTTEWAEYSYTSEVLHTDVKLEFLCSGTEVPFWLDLVTVYEAE